MIASGLAPDPAGLRRFAISCPAPPAPPKGARSLCDQAFIPTTRIPAHAPFAMAKYEQRQTTAELWLKQNA